MGILLEQKADEGCARISGGTGGNYISKCPDYVGEKLKDFGRHVKNNFLRYTTIGAMIGTATARADATIIYSFEDLINTSGTSQTIEMNIDWEAQTVDNLMKRDPITGIDSIVEKEGVVWRMGFIKYVPGGFQYGAYANTDNGISNNNPTIAAGYMRGRFWDSVFPDGSTADEVILIADPIGGDYEGMAQLNGGSLTFNPDITSIYFNKDLEVDGVQGGNYGPFAYLNPKTMKHTVINPIPEPASILLLCSGLLGVIKFMRRKKHE